MIKVGAQGGVFVERPLWLRRRGVSGEVIAVDVWHSPDTLPNHACKLVCGATWTPVSGLEARSMALLSKEKETLAAMCAAHFGQGGPEDNVGG